MLDYLNQWFTAYLYAGTVVNTAYVVYPFKLLIYVFPFHWGYNALVYLELHTTTNWEGAVECRWEDVGQAVPQCPNGTGTACIGFKQEHGAFCCPNIKDPSQCYGSTGLQVLERLHGQFEVVTSENKVWDDIGCMLIFAVIMKFAYTFNLYSVCYPKSNIKPIPTPVQVIISVRDTIGSSVGFGSYMSVTAPRETMSEFASIKSLMESNKDSGPSADHPNDPHSFGRSGKLQLQLPAGSGKVPPPLPSGDADNGV